MADAALHRIQARGRSESVLRSTLRSLGMTTNTDGVRWSVLGPIIIGSIAFFGGFVYIAGGISENVKSLSTDIAAIKIQLTAQSSSMSDDTKHIKEQLGVQASTLTHLEDEFHFGGTRMDSQDRELAEIKAQLAALKEQVAAERQAPRK